MKNARFWIMNPANCDSLVKLTLKPGQRLAHGFGGPHEEGWSSHFETWTYDEYSQGIQRQYVDDGRDCDGRLTEGGNDWSAVHDLAAVPHCPQCFGILDADDHPGACPYPGCGTKFAAPMLAPKWSDHEYDPIYDEFAQAAGY